MAKKRKRQRGPHPFRVQIIRYHDARGARCKSTDPGAVKSATESEAYYADLHDRGKRERVPLETSILAEA